ISSRRISVIFSSSFFRKVVSCMRASLVGFFAFVFALGVSLSGCSSSDDTPAPPATGPGHFTYVFAGTQGGHVYRSADKGMTWTDVSTGLPVGSAIRAISIDGNTMLAGTNKGVYRTDDDGGHWDSLGGGYLGHVYAVLSD